MISAGWYQDPSDPNRQRYWDGVQWTEQVQGPPTAGVHEQPPVSFNQGQTQGYGQDYGQGLGGSPVDSVKPIGPGFGDWFGATFGGFIKGFVGAVGIMMLYSTIFWVLLIGVGYAVVSDLVLREDVFGDLDIQGFEVGPALYGLGAVALLGLVLQYAGIISGYHYMYKTHMDGARSFLGSLGAGLKGLPKYLLFFLVFLIVFGGAYAGLFFVAGVLAEGNAGVAAGAAIIGFLLFFVMMFVAIRLVYVPLTAAVSPDGEGFIAASWRASRGRFRPIFGRLIVVSIIGFFVSLIGSSISNVFLVSALPFEQTATGGVLLDGVQPDIADGIVIRDFLPSLVGFGIYLAFTAFVQAVQLALFASGTAAMYIQDQDADKLKV